MKIVGILCSPRKGGNTEVLLKEALNSAKNEGAETELLTVRGRELKPCDGCDICLRKNGKCRIKDDMQEIYLKLLDADGIIWASPVYFYTVTAQAKIIIDRTFALGNRMRNKIGGVISVASSLGHSGIRNLFNSYFQSKKMFAADFVYGFGREKGDVLKDKHALQSSRELGKQIVLLVKQNLKFPNEYDVAINKYVERKYGYDRSPARGRFEK